MNTPSSTSIKLLTTLTEAHPDISFISDSSFFWSPKDASVHYNEVKLTEPQGLWSLVHELAHGLLQHATYRTDFELLSYEVAAWQKAVELAPDLGVNIDSGHIDDCLNTYRDWLYARSTCPTCRLNSLQISADMYQCINCQCRWRVSPSRFCRPYRLKINKQKTPTKTTQSLFA